MNETIIHSLPDLAAFAHQFIEDLTPKETGAVVITLSGNLGAGKTTFVQMLSEVLGVEAHIVSPTFVLMRTYATKHPVWKKFVHIDAYRLEQEGEADVLRLPELFRETDSLIAIEWPERIRGYLPHNAVSVAIEILPDESRKIITRYGD